MLAPQFVEFVRILPKRNEKTVGKFDAKGRLSLPEVTRLGGGFVKYFWFHDPI